MGLWLEIKILENVKIFDATTQVKEGFKFELLEVSWKITVEHIAVWFEEVSWKTAGNCMFIESELTKVEKVWVISKLYCTLVLSLSLLEIPSEATRVGFYFIHKGQHDDSYIWAYNKPMSLYVDIVKLEVVMIVFGHGIAILTKRSGWK